MAAGCKPWVSPGRWGGMGPALGTPQKEPSVQEGPWGEARRPEPPWGWQHCASPREEKGQALKMRAWKPLETQFPVGWLAADPTALSPSLFPREDNWILVQVCVLLRNNLSKQAHPKQSQEEQPDTARIQNPSALGWFCYEASSSHHMGCTNADPQAAMNFHPRHVLNPGMVLLLQHGANNTTGAFLSPPMSCFEIHAPWGCYLSGRMPLRENW